MFRSTLLTTALFAGFVSTASPALADDAKLTGEAACDSAYLSEGATGWNAQFSPNPGCALDLNFGNDTFYADVWGRRSINAPEVTADVEIDFGGGFNGVPIGNTGVTLDGFVGRWQYGEDLAVGDTVVRLVLNSGNLHVAATNLSGITDTLFYNVSYDIPVNDSLTISPSVAYIEALRETNFGISASYSFATRWRIDADLFFPQESSVTGGVRLARSFETF